MKRQRQLKYQATEKGRACRRRWYANHVEERRAVSKDYRDKNKDKVASWKKEDYIRNRDRISVQAKSRHIKTRYGLSPERFEAMAKKQGYCCAICREPFISRPNVDHCHVTGYTRALLCQQCNVAIGFLRHNHVIALSAAHYLSKEVLFNV